MGWAAWRRLPRCVRAKALPYIEVLVRACGAEAASSHRVQQFIARLGELSNVSAHRGNSRALSGEPFFCEERATAPSLYRSSDYLEDCPFALRSASLRLSSCLLPTGPSLTNLYLDLYHQLSTPASTRAHWLSEGPCLGLCAFESCALGSPKELSLGFEPSV